MPLYHYHHLRPLSLKSIKVEEAPQKENSGIDKSEHNGLYTLFPLLKSLPKGYPRFHVSDLPNGRYTRSYILFPFCQNLLPLPGNENRFSASMFFSLDILRELTTSNDDNMQSDFLSQLLDPLVRRAVK